MKTETLLILVGVGILAYMFLRRQNQPEHYTPPLPQGQQTSGSWAAVAQTGIETTGQLGVALIDALFG